MQKPLAFEEARAHILLQDPSCETFAVFFHKLWLV